MNINGPLFNNNETEFNLLFDLRSGLVNKTWKIIIFFYQGTTTNNKCVNYRVEIITYLPPRQYAFDRSLG